MHLGADYLRSLGKPPSLGICITEAVMDIVFEIHFSQLVWPLISSYAPGTMEIVFHVFVLLTVMSARDIRSNVVEY